MSDLADRTITALRSCHDKLDAVVAGMSPAELEQPSAASDWTVAQVLSHLGSGSELMSATLAKALTGTEPAESNEQVWARWDAMPAAEQAARFRTADEALVRRFESLDETARAELTVDLGFLDAPLDVAGVGALRLNELALHTWDIQVMADPAAVVSPQATEFLFRPLEMLIGFIGQLDALGDRKGVVKVTTTEPDRSFWLDLRETAAIVDDPGIGSVGVLNLPAEALLRLTAGRLAPEHTPPGAVLTSNTLTLDDLRRVFPGF